MYNMIIETDKSIIIKLLSGLKIENGNITPTYSVTKYSKNSNYILECKNGYYRLIRIEDPKVVNEKKILIFQFSKSFTIYNRKL